MDAKPHGQFERMLVTKGQYFNSWADEALNAITRRFSPGSVRTSFAAAMSMNLFSASFFSSSDWKLSGCHC